MNRAARECLVIARHFIFRGHLVRTSLSARSIGFAARMSPRSGSRCVRVAPRGVRAGIFDSADHVDPRSSWRTGGAARGRENHRDKQGE